MLYQFESNAAVCSLQPFVHRHRRRRWIALGAIVVAAVMPLLPLNPGTRYIVYSLAALCVLEYVYTLLFKSRVTLLFDKREQVVYRNVAGLFRMRLLAFADITIVATQKDPDGLYYGIAAKNNRYGKNYAISDFFNNDEEQEQFETLILPELEACLINQAQR